MPSMDLMKFLPLPGAACLAAFFVGVPIPALSQSPTTEEESLPAASAPRTRDSVLNHRFPRLVVVISIDQLRQDYLTRFSDQFLPAFNENGNVGGFRFLMERGAYFGDNHYSHVPTFTGPGHATILTGATLTDSGIIANDWLTSTGQSMYCVEDASVEAVGAQAPSTRAKKGSASPRNLEAETVGDALRLANNRQSKVVGVAIKDRASILMTGKNPTAAVWFDSNSGNWITSTYYTTGTLPSFAERANRERIADQWIGKDWDYLLPREQYVRSGPEGQKGTTDARGLGNTFPKKLSAPGAQPDKKYWEQMTFTPYGNEFVLQTARMAIQDEGLGEDDHPDILAINFSTNDYIGHSFGPNSPEVQDATIRTDRALAGFFNDLRTSRTTGLSDVVLVLTSDHGVAPVPEWAAESMRYDAGRNMYEVLVTAANEALKGAFPDQYQSGVVAGFGEPYIYFNLPKIKETGIDLHKAREVVAQNLRALHGVKSVYTRDQIERGQLPHSATSTRIYNGFHPERSGDVFVLSDPFWYPSRSATGTTHGSAFAYDTQVPLLIAGPTIRPGFYTRRTDMRDIAPTLATLLGITHPASSSGRVLSEALY